MCERDGMYTCWELCVRVCTELWMPRASLLGYGGRPAAAPGWRVLESIPAPRRPTGRRKASRTSPTQKHLDRLCPRPPPSFQLTQGPLRAPPPGHQPKAPRQGPQVSRPLSPGIEGLVVWPGVPPGCETGRGFTQSPTLQRQGLSVQKISGSHVSCRTPMLPAAASPKGPGPPGLWPPSLRPVSEGRARNCEINPDSEGLGRACGLGDKPSGRPVPWPRGVCGWEIIMLPGAATVAGAA